MRCGDCKYWISRDGLKGDCHRAPPHPKYGWPETFGLGIGCGEGARKPAKRNAPVKQSWTVRAANIWEEQTGGLLPFGRLGKALKPLIEKHGEDKVLDAWLAYLTATDTKFMSPKAFAGKYGQWAGMKPKSSSTQPSEKGNADYDRFLGGG